MLLSKWGRVDSSSSSCCYCSSCTCCSVTC